MPVELPEWKLILNRVGIFDATTLYQELTVCPAHRCKLGIYFKSNAICCYPSHTGNGKTIKGITSDESRLILQKYNTLIPIGSGKL